MRELRDFIKIVDNLERVYTQMPREIGRIAVNFSKERFRAQNWVDNNTDPWKKRRFNGKGKSASRGILVGKGSGRLKRSIRLISATQTLVKIGTDVPYAQVHNEGGVIEVTENMRRYFAGPHLQTLQERTQAIQALKSIYTGMQKEAFECVVVEMNLSHLLQ